MDGTTQAQSRSCRGMLLFVVSSERTVTEDEVMAVEKSVVLFKIVELIV
jgi:hypothetical protein